MKNTRVQIGIVVIMLLCKFNISNKVYGQTKSEKFMAYSYLYLIGDSIYCQNSNVYDTLWSDTYATNAGGYIFQWYKDGQLVQSDTFYGYFGNLGNNSKYFITDTGSYYCVTTILSSNYVFTSRIVEIMMNPNCFTGIKEINTSNSLEFSPNPFITTTTLTLQGTYHNPTLFIYNLLGQEVRSIPVGTNQQITIQRNQLASGMYFYKVIDENKEVIGIGKMVVE